jgi:hypothetical protein
MSPDDLVENRIEDGNFSRWRGSRIEDATASGGSSLRKNCPKLPRVRRDFSGNDTARDELGHLMRWRLPAPIFFAKERAMRNTLLAVAAIAGAITVPVAARAQSDTVGIVRGGTVVIDDNQGIAVDQRPAFREYIVRERVPTYTIPDRVIVGGVLPETGVTYYDVPQTYGVTPYRYTVVNGQTVLVEPRSRRIVQVVE